MQIQIKARDKNQAYCYIKHHQTLIIRHVYQTFCIKSQYSTKSNKEPPREVGYGQNESSRSFSNHERRAQTYSNTLILTQTMKKREDTQVYNRSVRVAKIVLTQE